MPACLRATGLPLTSLALILALGATPALAAKLDSQRDAEPSQTEAGEADWDEGEDFWEIDFGDDSSRWAEDGECDDPRFTGPGMSSELEAADLGADASDCRAAYEAGTVEYSEEASAIAAAEFDYGADWSRWAHDGVCDDPRFTGPGTDKKLLEEDAFGDASDCQALEAEGQVSIIPVYRPDYAANAPYDSSHIDFGDNESDYADNETCDDPRFMGPGTDTVLLDSDLLHDAEDCRAAYEAGLVVLIGE